MCVRNDPRLSRGGTQEETRPRVVFLLPFLHLPSGFSRVEYMSEFYEKLNSSIGCQIVAICCAEAEKRRVTAEEVL